MAKAPDLVAMCIAQGMILLDVTIVNVALPSIQRELRESSGELEWVISAYALSLAALIPLSGSLGDRFGRKRFFAAGMVVFALGSMACALSSSAVELIAARAFQGVGGAMMSALALSILSQAYSGKPGPARSGSGQPVRVSPSVLAQWSEACYSGYSGGHPSSGSTCRSPWP
jgi:MFS family permease